jgi:hypothetical protein
MNDLLVKNLPNFIPEKGHQNELKTEQEMKGI